VQPRNERNLLASTDLAFRARVRHMPDGFRFFSCSPCKFSPSNEQLFRNLVREGLPTIRELNDLVPRDVPCRGVAFGSGL
jgi:hypothetical protein